MSSTAPIDRRWRDDFVVGLQLRDVEPEVIADQLKLVQTHCAESGEAAQEAFGDPTAYAQVVAREAGATESPMGDIVQLLPAGVGGFLAGRLLFEGVTALVGDGSVEFHLGDLLGAAVIIGVVFVVLRLLRSGRTLLTYVVTAAAVAFAVLLDVADTPLLLTLPAWPALVLGVLALAVVAWAVRRAGRQGRILDPVDGSPLV